MALFKVTGEATITVTIEVEANSEEEAIEKAGEQFDGVVAFVGNGGTDKLIGVYHDNETIEAPDYVEFDNAEEIEEE